MDDGQAPHVDSLTDQDADEYDKHAAHAVSIWPEIDFNVETIVNRISKVDRYVERAAVDTLKELGLAKGELKVLLSVNRKGRRSPGEIGQHLLVSTGTMTNRLDKLEEAGLVKRLRDPQDRRGVLVELTPDGRETLDRYIAVQAKRERELMSAMSKEERVALATLLRRLLASVEERAGFSIR
ncbi:MAG: MarR family transcriptional regulator [Acidimicrobiales bacterium]